MPHDGLPHSHDHDDHHAAPAPGTVDWKLHGVKVIPASSLDTNTAQTPGMNRAAAINLARVGAQKIWAGTVNIHAGAKTGVHHHGALESVIYVLKGRARIKRTMWSRRAQEYEAKINSGDPISIAEVVRDLHRNAGQPDQSFSERQIYEAAMDRLAAELGALDQTDKNAALVKLGIFLKAA